MSAAPESAAPRDVRRRLHEIGGNEPGIIHAAALARTRAKDQFAKVGTLRGGSSEATVRPFSREGSRRRLVIGGSIALSVQHDTDEIGVVVDTACALGAGHLRYDAIRSQTSNSPGKRATHRVQSPPHWEKVYSEDA
jgi:hypothetical protein